MASTRVPPAKAVWVVKRARHHLNRLHQRMVPPHAAMTGLIMGAWTAQAITVAADLGVAGTAHGVSLHDELRLLVLAGFTPIEALRAATVLPADRFGLTDRGRIQAGLRADLVLVDGDATVTIGDTLSMRAVWRQGTRLAVEPAGARA
jgi:adenine deaminase